MHSRWKGYLSRSATALASSKKKREFMVGYDGCLHEACGCSLDSPPAYNPMHLRPSIVRVCRACFSLPLEAAELHPEFDLDPGENR